MNVPANPLDLLAYKTIEANGHTIQYAEHGAGWRYDTLLEKEPETIEWIDTFEPGDTLWDIGANVGIYSIYAAIKGIRTMGFEPHFANYQQFCITIAINGLQDVVTPLCLAFSESKSISQMHLASLDIGTSMSNFGEALDFRGNQFQPAFRQGIIGYDIDSFITDFGAEIPTHLKIDVDGIELPIIRGAKNMLANDKLQSVSVELIESDLQQVAAVTEILEDAGLQFVHKRQNSAFATPETHDVLNYLFHRDPTKLARLRDRVKAHDGPFTTDQIIERLVLHIASAPVDATPSDNIFIENVLPQSVYRELLERLPPDAAFGPIDHPDAVAPDGRCTRFLLDLTPHSLARMASEHQPFWAAMIEILTAPAIAHAVVAKFESTLRQRFGDAMPELVAVPILYRDHPGYQIRVHPDAACKVATLQLYLPEDDSQRHLGTVFHHREGDVFTQLKTNKFLPNTAYAFVRTEESWHSVDELAPSEKVRNSLALTFYVKGQEYRSDMQPDASASTPGDVSAPYYDDILSQALQKLAKSFTRRENVATLFRQGGVGVELGVAAGDFSERILKHEQVGYLYSIDMWAGDRGHGPNQYREAIARLAPYRDRNAILRMRFDEALPLFDDGSLDFIYVDGYAHDGELNGQTFRDWFPKLRQGGIISGDDYSPEWPLVVAAVNDFVATNGLELHVIDCHEAAWNSQFPTWFAMKP